MTDQPRVSTPIGSRSAVRRSYIRTSSQSPARHQHRLGDDLLPQLSPNTAVDALRSPTGALKTCMDRASLSEQAFAMRAAIASKKIRDWLDELSSWPWPKDSGSAGFEMPPAKERKFHEAETSKDDQDSKLPESDLPSDTEYLGSLPAADVERYDIRVDQIQRDLDGLDLEEIKNQVLHNHILPLSRPSSPFSDGGRSTASTSMYTRMEDLTAVVTAITVQALPNISRLSRLLNTWNIRVLVLRKVPTLMLMMKDAEVTLRSGWSAIESPNSSPTRSGFEDGIKRSSRPKLSRDEFNIIKNVIQQKITKPGRALDYMLDSLEGSMDTLPEEWLDRMENIEKDYAIWETTAERKLRANDNVGLLDSPLRNVPLKEPETPGPKIQIEGPSPTRETPELASLNQFASPPTPSDFSPEAAPTKAMRMPQPKLSKKGSGTLSHKSSVKFAVDEPKRNARRSPSPVVGSTANASHQRDFDSGSTVKDSSFNYDDANEKRPAAIKAATARSSKISPEIPRLTKPKLSRPVSRKTEITDGGQVSPVLGEVDRNIVRSPPLEHKKSDQNTESKMPAWSEELESPVLESSVLEPSVLEPVDEEGEELDLPPARFEERRDSGTSLASTVLHGRPDGFPDSDNAPFRDSSMEPDLPRLPDPDEPFSSDAISPPSSPPLRYKTRSTSVTFKDVPEIAPLPEAGNTPPRSPIESPEVFDGDASFEYESQHGSPGRMSTMSSVSDDEHLQQQISDILESIPAKIRLKRTPGINLNPPDFQHPSRPKSKVSDNTRRSGSSLSSRAGTPSSFSRSGTPSFMLAPARDARPRTKSSQGIRVYHLSRSTGEPPLKLLIRGVGEKGERVMVRIGGGWADLGEYLREYALHHGSRSKGEGKVDIRDAAAIPSGIGSSPSSRPGSAMDSPITPLYVRKTRKSLGEEGAPSRFPKTPFAHTQPDSETPNSEHSLRSRASSSHMDWDEEDSALGLAGPKGKKVDMSDESRAWVESVKEKVRIASGERVAPPDQRLDTKFGEIGRVGGTKRLFRKN